MRHVAASRIGVSAVLSAALLVVALALAGSGGATFAGRDGRIVFAEARGVRQETLQADLYSLDVASGRSRHVSRFPSGINGNFALSPDGTRVAFLHLPPGPTNGAEWHPWLMGVDGSDQRELADFGVSVPMVLPGSLAWSPDGTAIAFIAPASASAPHPYDDVLWVANADGSGLRELTDVEAAYPSWSPDGSEIAFVGNPVANGVGTSIGVVGASGAGVRFLAVSTPCGIGVDAGCTTTAPAWSPDGKALIFARGDSLVLIGADGSGERTLTTGIANGVLTCAVTCDLGQAALQWSPRTDEIVFIASDGNIEFVRPDGSRLQTLVCHDCGPIGWSPTGDRFAFVRGLQNRMGFAGLELVIEPSHGPATIFPFPAGLRSAASPAWLPSGESILYFASSRFSAFELLSITARGGDPQLLTHGNLDSFDPVWSPDGRRIAFARGEVSAGYSAVERSTHPSSIGRSSLYLMGADGSHVRRLTRSGVDAMPSWSPDGRHIVFARRHGLGFEVQIVDTRTGRIRRLTSQGSNPAWSPDGHLISFAEANTLRIIRPDQGGERTLYRAGTSRTAQILRPAWSPNGRAIAFTLASIRSDGTLAGQRQLTISRLGGAPRSLPCAPASWRGPDIPRVAIWSPSGDAIDLSDGGAIWACPSNASSARFLHFGDEPDWQTLH